MKKLLLLVGLLFIFITNVKAIDISNTVCDYKKQDANTLLANKINYVTSFNMQLSTFTITFYNIVPELVLSYNGAAYAGDGEYKTVISDIPEGTSMKVDVYSSDTGCNYSLITLYINAPYYNTFFGSEKCSGYEEVLIQCSSKFLEYDMTDTILDSAITNYNNRIQNEPTNPGAGNKTFLESVGSFMMNWGIKILLVAITIALSVWLFRVKFRKIKHGI